MQLAFDPHSTMDIGFQSREDCPVPCRPSVLGEAGIRVSGLPGNNRHRASSKGNLKNWCVPGCQLFPQLRMYDLPFLSTGERATLRHLVLKNAIIGFMQIIVNATEIASRRPNIYNRTPLRIG
jgi:hypothetical protein